MAMGVYSLEEFRYWPELVGLKDTPAATQDLEISKIENILDLLDSNHRILTEEKTFFVSKIPLADVRSCQALLGKLEAMVKEISNVDSQIHSLSKLLMKMKKQARDPTPRPTLKPKAKKPSVTIVIPPPVEITPIKHELLPQPKPVTMKVEPKKPVTVKVEPKKPVKVIMEEPKQVPINDDLNSSSYGNSGRSDNGQQSQSDLGSMISCQELSELNSMREIPGSESNKWI